MFRFKRFTPKLFVDDIFQIPLSLLEEKGKKALLFDLDNTITAHHSAFVDEKTCAWFSSLEDYGLRACLLSNNKDRRVKKVAEQLKIPYIHRAKKPGKAGFKRAFTAMDTDIQASVMVGDQLFTDIWGGNRAGLYTILVRPISKKELWGTRHISRPLERLIWRFVHRNLNQKP